MAPEDKPSESVLQNGSGEVWVKDGKVFVKNPSGTGNPPTIAPCPEIDIFVNGNKVEGKTEVGENDEIVLTPRSIEEPGEYKIRIAPDGLSAELELKTGTVTRYVLRDSEPKSELVLKAEKVVEKTLPFSPAGFMGELAGKNIIFGVKHDEIRGILANPEDGLYTIAGGEPPGDSVDERVELHFALEPGEKAPDTKDHKINLRDRFEIPSVEQGALLAVKHSGEEGSPGRKVTGEIIPPPKPRVFELTAGKGAEISPDGARAYARVSGLPTARKVGARYIIDVDPVLRHRGDVDISSGNIRFKGDVVVHGNVREGMTVQAAGKIDIKGMVFQARIAAQGDINAGQNITGSTIVAGGNNSFFKSLHKILGQLHADLAAAAAVIPALARHPRMEGVKTGQLVQLLVDKKYPRVPGLIAEMVKLANQNSFIIPWKMALLLEKIDKQLSGLNLLKLDSMEKLNSLLGEMKEVQGIIDEMARDRAGITFGYAINSKLEASGEVKVVGRGCINTSIRAGGNVNIKGVFRGGEIIAGGDVFLNEAGSEMGARTFIKTGEGRKVYVKKAFAGIQIQVGDRRASITSPRNNIKAELDEDGALLISSLSKV